ncbi:Uncharacterized conserved protein YbjT, contains NAD(P)-binding and DUF2867 domains [Paramicrobacterium humi]|uniref:Uncharacterized conserved protein YbjT, contains NAD(P)-binding and DUF2867 domains n=1 Tax=Paramicrobacterium humi TaxID=640635 RepID=A0A1H4LF75_9MICO|nr:NAD(P)H-binding protein [Microbacterium humi]SEB69399.1 Uncharacterized conserved protein YbjT, contains NAD(P)-binding and DUF2867 domains [Microbacterium humi]
MPEILVTGGTGRLGVPTVDALRRAGHAVRVLSRRPGAGRALGDLVSGVGVPEALEGVDTVLHLATSGLSRDEETSALLFRAAERAGIRHLIYLSIVGVDRIPMPYYRTKLAVERMLEDSPLPHTILRATQFHELVTGLFTVQRRLPVLFVPRIGFQSISTLDVAARLTELAASDAAGRVPDIGGPERLSAAEYARRWRRASGSRGRVVTFRLPGKLYRALRERRNMVPGPPYGTRTYEDYLAERYGAVSPG